VPSSSGTLAVAAALLVLGGTTASVAADPADAKSPWGGGKPPWAGKPGGPWGKKSDRGGIKVDIPGVGSIDTGKPNPIVPARPAKPATAPPKPAVPVARTVPSTPSTPVRRQATTAPALRSEPGDSRGTRTLKMRTVARTGGSAPRPARRPVARSAAGGRAAVRRRARRARAGSARRAAPEKQPAADKAKRAAAPRDDGDAVTRTVRRLVEVVPDSLKRTIGALGVLSLGLGGAYLVAVVRSRRLERQRTELLGEVGLLQGALLPPVPEQLGGLRTSVA